jgi:hypothetical protein
MSENKVLRDNISDIEKLDTQAIATPIFSTELYMTRCKERKA